MSYVVIENAGYVGEYIYPNNFKDIGKAEKFINRKYNKKEREELHVAIAVKLHNGDISFEF